MLGRVRVRFSLPCVRFGLLRSQATRLIGAVLAWLCEIVRGPNDALLVSSSVAALSSRAFPLHMQKPLADAPARVGGDGAAVGTHDPMVGDDHGEWVFSYRGPNSAV